MFTPRILIAEFIISNLDKDMAGGIKADLILLFWITKKKKESQPHDFIIRYFQMITNIKLAFYLFIFIKGKCASVYKWQKRGNADLESFEHIQNIDSFSSFWEEKGWKIVHRRKDSHWLNNQALCVWTSQLLLSVHVAAFNHITALFTLNYSHISLDVCCYF